ncbi:MAG: ArnT family glycosyltransferase [Thermoanaerobaculia bacterium]
MFEPVRKYLQSLATPPEPLSRLERWLFALAMIFVAATRFRARSLTPWDWDEALFSLAMDDYNVIVHRPHPPGFPLFIGAAKLVRPFVDSNFHALQWIAIAGAIAHFPAIVFAAREARLPFGTALGGAFLCSFIPSVWFFGGTAFSDVPSIALAMTAMGFLLRGCRSPRAYILGAIVLAIAMGFRMQNLSLGMAPGLIATGYRVARKEWRYVALAAILGAVIVGGAYGGAVRASGPLAEYRQTLELHSDYIERVDSFRNPERTPLHRLIYHFFVNQYSYDKANIVISILVLLSFAFALLRRYGPMLMLLAAIGPFAVSAWLLLDVNSVHRFSIGYIPLFAVLAADGARLVGSAVSKIVRPAIPAWIQALVVLSLVAVLFEWSNPALRIVRETPSPTWAATQWVRDNLDPKRDTVYVAGGMWQFARDALKDFRTTRLPDDRNINAPEGERTRGVLLTDNRSDQPGAVTFLRKRTPLNQITRDMFFEASVIPLRAALDFQDGWYEAEAGVIDAWRWMGGRSRTLLPPINGPAELRIEFSAPSVLDPPPVVTLTLNGNRLDSFRVPKSALTRIYPVQSRVGEPNELVIETDRVVNPRREGISADGRDLGLALRSMWWGEAEMKQ